MGDFIISPEARDDLLAIQDYIAADSPRAAARVIDDIFSAFEILAENPHMGHIREDLTRHPVRFWPVHSYLIVYIATSEPIGIARILSGYRDLVTELNR